jgi:hypothetical protein
MTINRRLFSFGSLATLLAPTSRSALAGSGSFLGKIVTEWLPDGRNMKLLGAIQYVSPDGTTWPVPAGTIVDGASIPTVFWSVIGGPFEGQYRGPSVIHDFYCEARIRACADVHKVFFDAMLTAGVGQKQAWLMYQAVSRFGPQWKDPKIDPKCQVVDDNYDFERCARNAAKPEVTIPKPNKSDLLQFSKSMESEADPADLEKLRNALK